MEIAVVQITQDGQTQVSQTSRKLMTRCSSHGAEEVVTLRGEREADWWQLPVVLPGSAGCCHIHSSGRAPAGEEASHWSADRWPKSPVQSQQPPRCRLQ